MGGRNYYARWLLGVEMAIPFKSIRFKESNTSWNFNAYRIDSNTGERSVDPIPRNFVLIHWHILVN